MDGQIEKWIMDGWMEDRWTDGWKTDKRKGGHEKYYTNIPYLFHIIPICDNTMLKKRCTYTIYTMMYMYLYYNYTL